MKFSDISILILTVLVVLVVVLPTLKQWDARKRIIYVKATQKVENREKSIRKV